MKGKKIQSLMAWLLPVIIIGGLFWPALGYLVVAMMAFFLPLSVFKGRYWCWHLCPRGAFLDLVLSKFTFNKPIPRIFTKAALRWSVFAMLALFLILRMIHAGGNILAIGAVFVMTCLITTVVAIVLGIPTKHRAWCVICPMGTLQETLGRHASKK